MENRSAPSSKQQRVTLHIQFQVPARQQSDGEAPVHERHLTGVPRSVAQEVVEAFTAYTEDGSEADRREAYTYEKADEPSSGGEMLLALDFGEIISIKASPDEERAS